MVELINEGQRSEEHESIGSVMRSFRKSIGISQPALARKMGVSYPSVNHYELGRKIPGDKKLVQIMQGLDLTVEQRQEFLKRIGRDTLLNNDPVETIVLLHTQLAQITDVHRQMGENIARATKLAESLYLSGSSETTIYDRSKILRADDI